MKSLDLRPLAWGFGGGLGVTFAIALGAYGLSWGPTLAFPAVALLLSAGAYLERDGQGMANILRFALGFTLGYLACAIPLTWNGLAASVERLSQEDPAEAAAQLELARRQLFARWAAIALAVPGAIAALALRRRRDGAG